MNLANQKHVFPSARHVWELEAIRFVPTRLLNGSFSAVAVYQLLVEGIVLLWQAVLLLLSIN